MLIDELSTKNHTLDKNDFSIRFHIVSGKLKAPIEIEILAHNFKERIKKVDIIPKKILKSLLHKNPNMNIKVFLFLGSMGFN